MSKENIPRLHNVLLSGSYERVKDQHPYVQKLYDEPHLAIFINGDWLPILPGMIIGLVKNRAHVDGIAPYKLKKVNAKPGHEFIDLVAYSSDNSSTRRLQFLANYSGVFRSATNDGEQVVEQEKDGDKQ